MAVPFQHTVFAGCQRKHVARPPEIFRAGLGTGALPGCHAPFGCGNAGGGADMVNGHGKGCFMVIGIVGYHLGEFKLSAQLHAHGHTDKAPAVYGHEIHVFRGGVLGGADKVAFVFPVFIVCYQYDFTLAQVLQHFFYGVESFYGIEFFHGC